MAPKRKLGLAAGGGGVAAKRLRVAVPGPAVDGGRPVVPATRLLRKTVLMDQIPRRNKNLGPCKKQSSRRTKNQGPCKKTVTESISQIGHMVQKLHKVQSLIVSKLESIEERIQALTHKVDQITPSRPNHHNHQRLMHQSNQEGTSAEGLATNEDEGKSATVRLRFLNGMKIPVYHDDEIKADSNAAIKIGIFDGEEMIKAGPLSKVRVEILALEGNFPYDADSWTAKEFIEHRAGGRDGKGNVLAGKCTVQLVNGVASLSTIKFREGSCRARTGMFIIGARVCEGARTDVRVQEAVMKPVVVQDRRNKSNEKSHPPKLDDRVHRLEEIANDGIYCKRLEEKRIFTVQDFLRALNKDPDNLAKILEIKKAHKPWEKMVRHARECCLKGKHELKSYRYTEGNVVLFFNCVHFLVGAAFDGHYTASDKFNPAQQAVVDKLKERAYDQLDALPLDHVMEGDFPVLISMNANDGAGPSFFMSSASQPNQSAQHAAHQVQGFEAIEGLSRAQIESSCANANNNPISIPDQHNTHNYQGNSWSIVIVPFSAQDAFTTVLVLTDQGTQPSGQVQFPSPSLTDWHQNPLGQLDSSDWASEEFYLGADDDEMMLSLNQARAINQPCCVAPGFDQVELQRQLFLTSTHSNTTLTPQQLTFHGAPGPAQVSMQSQRQAPLPRNGPSVSEASTSTRNQSNLTPQQWSQCHGSMPWGRLP